MSNARWECSACTYSNEPAQTVCAMCNTAAPERHSTSSRSTQVHPIRPSESIELKDISATGALQVPGRGLSSSVASDRGSVGGQNNGGGGGGGGGGEDNRIDFSCEVSEDVKDALKITGIILIPICVLLLIILLSISFQYIEYDQYGLKKNTATSRVSYDQVYDTGRYCWGPGYAALTFPKLYQNVNFDNANSLVVFTNTGINVTLEVSFQYKLQKEGIITLFRNYGTDFATQIANIGRASIKNAAVNFGVTDYFLNRQNISDAIVNQLQIDLKQIYADVPKHKFQLLNVSYPPIVADRFLQSGVIAQNTLENKAQQLADIYRADTTLQVNTILAQAQVVSTSAAAQISQIGYIAGAQAYHIRTTAEGLGIASVFEILNITDPNVREQYLSYYRVSQNQHTTVLFGLQMGSMGGNASNT